MTKACLDRGLPEPVYKYESSGFWVNFRKDIYNKSYLEQLGLNDRQVKAVLFVKEKSQINNSEYQKLNKISKATATRDLSELLNIEILVMKGSGKRDLYYTLSQ